MTIKDIARECGVAVGTVSRVLNNHPDVSEKTRKKVLEIVDKYDFVLNRNARMLKMQDGKFIVIIVKGSSSILLNSLLEIIQKRLEQLPYNTNVVVLDEYDNEALEARKIYYEQKPLGMIFLGGNPETFKDAFSEIHIPCVIISNMAENTDNINLSSVSTDDIIAAAYSAQYLVDNGHRKIGVIGGDIKSSDMSLRRYMGFLEVMDAAGCAFDYSKMYATAKYSFVGGYAAMEDLLSKCPDITAVFTMSDVMAIGACRKLKEMVRSVPEEISVVGFDGIPIAEYYCPKITTIRQKVEELSQNGLDILIDCIEKGVNPVHRTIPFEFIEGESVKRICLQEK